MGVFELFLEWFFAPLITFLGSMITNTIYSEAFHAVFYIESLCGLGGDSLASISQVIFLFAGSLLTLKLLHKLFNIYILGVDGDSTVSPLEYFKSYIKGLIVISIFTIAYGWMVDIITNFTEQVLTALGGNINWGSLQTLMAHTGVFMLIFLLIYFIFLVIILVNCFMNGFRMLVLRLGMPLACIGLIDNDNGLYAVFTKKMFQTAITACVQICLLQMSFLPFGSLGGIADQTFIPMLISIAILAYSLKVTHDLNEIFLTGAATGSGQKASAIGRGIQSAAAMLVKH